MLLSSVSFSSTKILHTELEFMKYPTYTSEYLIIFITQIPILVLSPLTFIIFNLLWLLLHFLCFSCPALIMPCLFRISYPYLYSILSLVSIMLFSKLIGRLSRCISIVTFYTAWLFSAIKLIKMIFALNAFTNTNSAFISRTLSAYPQITWIFICRLFDLLPISLISADSLYFYALFTFNNLAYQITYSGCFCNIFMFLSCNAPSNSLTRKSPFLSRISGYSRRDSIVLQVMYRKTLILFIMTFLKKYSIGRRSNAPILLARYHLSLMIMAIAVIDGICLFAHLVSLELFGPSHAQQHI